MNLFRSDLLAYTKQIGRKWILWLFALIDVIGLVVQIIFPQIQIPIGVFLSLAFFGFFWAGFQVYRDLSSQLPSRPIPPPPYEILPLSFEIYLTQEIPKIVIWLYISNYQNREITISSLELTSFNLSRGPSLDVIHHSGEITIPKSQSECILCERTLSESEIRAISRIQTRSHANATYNANSQAVIGRKHISQKFMQVHTNGRIFDIEQAEFDTGSQLTT